MKASFTTPPNTCGVGVVHEFDYHYADERNILKGTPGGTGFLMAGFIHGDSTCNRAYRALRKKYKIVYRSPTRVNVNSDNKFYFAVFDCQGTNAKIGFDKFYDRDRSYNDDNWG